MSDGQLSITDAPVGIDGRPVAVDENGNVVVARPLDSSPFRDYMTIPEARHVLAELVEEGHVCPVCDQFAKVYKRRIHTSMAKDLIQVYRFEPSEWFHLPDVIGYGGDFGKMKHWALVQEEMELRREDGGRAGFWRMTQLGRDWVRGWTTVPKYVRLYDGRSLGLIGEQVSIRDALGKKFDYAELMRL